jgi:hypothetical protein
MMSSEVERTRFLKKMAMGEGSNEEGFLDETFSSVGNRGGGVQRRQRP